MSGQGINRIAIKYRARLRPLGPEAYAFDTFMVSIQGKPYRPPRPGQDLQDVRDWLESSGFELDEHTRDGGHRGNDYQARHTEIWKLRTAQPTPPTREREPMTSAVRRLNADQFEVIDAAGTRIATADSKPNAEWAQLRIYDPRIYHLAFGLHTRYPQLKNRARSAGLLVARAMVAPNGMAHAYNVESRTKDGTIYLTTIPPDARHDWKCLVTGDWTRCPDMMFNAPVLRHGARCAHMAAAWITSRLAQPAPVTPAPTFDPTEPPPFRADTDPAFDAWASQMLDARREAQALTFEETATINQSRLALGLDTQN